MFAILCCFLVLIVDESFENNVPDDMRLSGLPKQRQQQQQSQRQRQQQQQQRTRFSNMPINANNSKIRNSRIVNADNDGDMQRDSRHYRLVAGLLSAPGNFDTRQACRDTWFQLAPRGSTTFFFIVGSNGNTTIDRRLDDEQVTHGDLMRIDLRENYRQLVFKTAALYDYLTMQRRFTFDFLLKTDDDSFVRIDKLIPLLESESRKLSSFRNHTYLYWGSHNYNVKRAAAPNHKWYDALWQDAVYPPYALGSAYALSADLVHILGSLPIARRPMHPVEDVATGIWLRAAIGESLLARVHAAEELFPLIKTGDTIGVCHASMIVRRHCDEPQLMHKLLANIRQCNDDICCGATQL